MKLASETSFVLGWAAIAQSSVTLFVFFYIMAGCLSSANVWYHLYFADVEKYYDPDLTIIDGSINEAKTNLNYNPPQRNSSLALNSNNQISSYKQTQNIKNLAAQNNEVLTQNNNLGWNGMVNYNENNSMFPPGDHPNNIPVNFHEGRKVFSWNNEEVKYGNQLNIQVNGGQDGVNSQQNRENKVHPE